MNFLLGALGFSGWPLFWFTRFHRHRFGFGLVVLLSLVTLWMCTILGGVGVAFHSAVPLYAWLGLPYLLTAASIARRKRGART